MAWEYRGVATVTEGGTVYENLPTTLNIYDSPAISDSTAGLLDAKLKAGDFHFSGGMYPTSTNTTINFPRGKAISQSLRLKKNLNLIEGTAVCNDRGAEYVQDVIAYNLKTVYRTATFSVNKVVTD